MTDTKKDELRIIVDTMEVSRYIKQNAENSIQSENILQKYRTENHELKTTLMKLRSLYTLKETATRASFDKKVYIY